MTERDGLTVKWRSRHHQQNEKCSNFSFSDAAATPFICTAETVEGCNGRCSLSVERFGFPLNVI